MMVSAKPLVLVDGSSYLYRAFHALKTDLRNSRNEPTGAIHVVLNMVQKLLDEHDPDRVAVVFDAPGKTFRDDLYADYKANRPPMPDELRSQVQPIVDAIEAMGVSVLRIAGVEADDVIGTLARAASRANLDTLISTGDKDMTQLVDEHVTVVNTMSDTTLDRTGVSDKFGVRPDQIVDYLTLIGDSSDNIPGVPGVGPKTAIKWLETYGDLEHVMAKAGSIGGKVGERLAENLDKLPLYRTLVTIKCDVDLGLELDDLRRGPPDLPRLREILEHHELRSLLRRLEERAVGATAPPTPSAPAERDYETVLGPAQLDRWLARLTDTDLVAVDTETTSLDYMEAKIVGISLATEPSVAAYIPLSHRYPGAPDQLDERLVLARLKPWLEDAARKKVGHHIKYDTHVFANYDITLRGIAFDTMLESYVLDSTATRHDMDSVAARYLGIQTTKYEEVAGKGAKQIGFDEVDIDVASEYSCEDADVTLKLHQALWPKLSEAPELVDVYCNIEQPLIAVLTAMERHGVKVDAALLAEQSKELSAAMLAAERAAHEAAGGPFNIGSPKQLQEVLYDKLELPVLGKTPKGQPSTAENVLQELAESYDLPRFILEYRALAKLKSTYTDKLPREINARTGRIHTSYHQAVAATGRLSSSEPNLQNIPIRTAEGRRIRQAFVAPRGFRLIAADYSQIELRIMAHLSEDASLRTAFAEEQDIHRATAAEVFNTALDDVTPDQRRAAKAINFGLIYGMSAFGLARQLSIPRGEAQAYVDLYFDRYPGVKRYMDRTREQARERGFVATVFGRRLYLPEINSRNPARRQYAERSAINAPMQGTAADIIKRAMIDVHAWLHTGAVAGHLIMQVHDELVLEVASRDVDAATARVGSIMEAAAELSVPLRVEVGIGANWDEAH
jgi:DNA polymerase I